MTNSHRHEVDIETVVDLADIITSLRELSDEELAKHGLAVDGTWDEVDDPVLLGPDGTPVDTWREGYPYDERMSRGEYEVDKRLLQIELLKLQTWVKDTGQRILHPVRGPRRRGQGRHDQAVHGAPEPARVHGRRAAQADASASAASGTSSATSQHLPSAGEIVLFDRSWYNRAVVERVMGFCSDEEYDEFMRQVPEFERMLVRSGITIIKFWFSVSRKEQITRFTIRRIDPVRQWKLSPTDLASLDRWDDYSDAKEAMFYYTSTDWRAVDRGAQQRQEARPPRGHALGAAPDRLRRQGPRHRPGPRPADRRARRRWCTSRASSPASSTRRSDAQPAAACAWAATSATRSPSASVTSTRCSPQVGPSSEGIGGGAPGPAESIETSSQPNAGVVRQVACDGVGVGGEAGLRRRRRARRVADQRGRREVRPQPIALPQQRPRLHAQRLPGRRRAAEDARPAGALRRTSRTRRRTRSACLDRQAGMFTKVPAGVLAREDGHAAAQQQRRQQTAAQHAVAVDLLLDQPDQVGGALRVPDQHVRPALVERVEVVVERGEHVGVRELAGLLAAQPAGEERLPGDLLVDRRVQPAGGGQARRLDPRPPAPRRG